MLNKQASYTRVISAMLLCWFFKNRYSFFVYVMDKTMKIKVIIAMLFLLLVMFGLQIACSPYAMKIEKVIIEREIESVSDKNLIH